MNIFDNISKVKFLSSKIDVFRKLFMLEEIRIIDILKHIPIDYKEIINFDNFDFFQEGKEVILNVVVSDFDIQKTRYLKRMNKKLPVKIPSTSLSGVFVEMVFFHIKDFQINRFLPNTQLKIKGTIKMIKDGISIVHPVILKDNHDSINEGKLWPVYRLNAGIKYMQFRNIIQKIIENVFVPNNEYIQSFIKIHQSTSIEEFVEHRKNIAKWEMVSFTTKTRIERQKTIASQGISIQTELKLANKLISQLPFVLTQDQLNVFDEITQDQRSDTRMIRLLQGDVGCGKTIVAILAILNVIECNKSSILLAPTSILAMQHYIKIKEFLSFLNLNIRLITSDTSKKDRQEIQNLANQKDLDILVGTHAAIEDSIQLNNIGLFVIDEQHNFGVDQRQRLTQKNPIADTLLMTATPIPRTMSMCLYGDINVSVIKNKPLDRLSIITSLVSEKKYDKLIESIKKKIAKGSLVYWVCPLIEKSEKLEDLTPLLERYSSLQKDMVETEIGILHGRLANEEKNQIITDFANSKLKLLVCTSVIEVGIDIKDADIMIIENPERFGLSQLHQMRGRIGRGSIQSYCILFHKNSISQKARQRLGVIKDHTDGFLIAQEDLKLRGAGDLLGTRQSGDNIFEFFDFTQDGDLLDEIHNISNKLQKDENNMNILFEIFDKQYSTIKI